MVLFPPLFLLCLLHRAPSKQKNSNTKKPRHGLVFYKQDEFWRWNSFGRQEFCIAGVLMFPWEYAREEKEFILYNRPVLLSSGFVWRER